MCETERPLHVWMVSQSSVLIRFQKLNLQKVCASLVDFHFRCCQLKGIWTNQYLSVFSHIESWLLEKRGLQQTQPIPLNLALGQFCPCAGVGTCPALPTIREAPWDVIWTGGQRALLYSFSFLHPDSPKINESVLCLFSELYFNISKGLSFQQQTWVTPCQAYVCVCVFLSLFQFVKNNWK